MVGPGCITGKMIPREFDPQSRKTQHWTRPSRIRGHKARPVA